MCRWSNLLLTWCNNIIVITHHFHSLFIQNPMMTIYELCNIYTSSNTFPRTWRLKFKILIRNLVLNVKISKYYEDILQLCSIIQKDNASKEWRRIMVGSLINNSTYLHAYFIGALFSIESRWTALRRRKRIVTSVNVSHERVIRLKNSGHRVYKEISAHIRAAIPLRDKM